MMIDVQVMFFGLDSLFFSSPSPHAKLMCHHNYSRSVKAIEV